MLGASEDADSSEEERNDRHVEGCGDKVAGGGEQVLAPKEDS